MAGQWTKGGLVITEDCLAHHMAVWRYLDDLGDDDDDNFGDMSSLMNIKCAFNDFLVPRSPTTMDAIKATINNASTAVTRAVQVLLLIIKHEP